MAINGIIQAGSITGNLSASGTLSAELTVKAGGSGPSAEDVFSAQGVDELTISGTSISLTPNVRNYIFPDATSISQSAFQKNTFVEEVEAPNAISVYASAFSQATSLNKVTLPKVETLNGTQIFYGTSSLKKIDLPELTSITTDAFSSSGVEEINIPKFNNLKQNNFSGAKKLKKLTVGNNFTISSSVNTQKAFYEMGRDVAKGSSEIDLEVTWSTYNSSYHRNIFQYMTVRSLTVKELSSYNGSNYEFQNMKAESISFPDLISLNGSSQAFASCEVDSINFPKLETLGSGSFRNMIFPADYDLTLPKVTAIPTNTFYATSGINSITLPLCTEINGSTYNMTMPGSMKHLYLPGSTMCALNAVPTVIFSNAFLTGEDTAVHVPSDLLADYQAATNWSDMASKIVGDLPAVNS